MFSEVGLNCEFGEDIKNYFIQDISKYITDMRLIKNIVNEYKIFKQEIVGNPSRISPKGNK